MTENNKTLEELNSSENIEAAVRFQLDTLLADSSEEALTEDLYEMVVSELCEQLENSTIPARYLMDELTEMDDNKEDIEKWDLDNRAMFLLAFQVMNIQTTLSAISKDELSCTHENVYAGNVVSDGNRIFTPSEMAAHCFRDLSKNESIQEDLTVQCHIQKMLEPYRQADGLLEIPEENRNFRAVQLLLEQLSKGLKTLEKLEHSDSLSCSHKTLYVDGIEEDSQKIPTSAEVAKNALKAMESIQLERIRLRTETDTLESE